MDTLHSLWSVDLTHLSGQEIVYNKGLVWCRLVLQLPNNSVLYTHTLVSLLALIATVNTISLEHSSK